jgi:hypothetical protein
MFTAEELRYLRSCVSYAQLQGTTSDIQVLDLDESEETFLDVQREHLAQLWQKINKELRNI